MSSLSKSSPVRALLWVLTVCWPIMTRAEVMDKEIVPWHPFRVLQTVFAALVCTVFAVAAGYLRGNRWSWRFLSIGVALGIGWAALGLLDDVLDPYVGPDMRREMSAAAYRAYVCGLFVESAAPLCACLAAKSWLRPTHRGGAHGTDSKNAQRSASGLPPNP
jgi:hypothetical protein